MTFYHTSTWTLLLSLGSHWTAFLPLTQTWQVRVWVYRIPVTHRMPSLGHRGAHVQPHRTLFLILCRSLLLFLSSFSLLPSILSFFELFKIKMKFWSIIFHTLSHNSIIIVVFYSSIYNLILKTFRKQLSNLLLALTRDKTLVRLGEMVVSHAVFFIQVMLLGRSSVLFEILMRRKHDWNKGISRNIVILN